MAKQCIFIGNRQLLSCIPSDAVIHFDGNNNFPSNHIKKPVFVLIPMSFDVHVNDLHRKVTGILTFINRIGKHFHKRTRIVVQSLDLSLICYCISMWGFTNNTMLNVAQMLQNVAANIAVGRARKYDHVFPFLFFRKIKKESIYL